MPTRMEFTSCRALQNGSHINSAKRKKEMDIGNGKRLRVELLCWEGEAAPKLCQYIKSNTQECRGDTGGSACRNEGKGLVPDEEGYLGGGGKISTH